MASMTEAKKADPKELNLALMKVNWMAQMWERHLDASKGSIYFIANYTIQLFFTCVFGMQVKELFITPKKKT